MPALAGRPVSVLIWTTTPWTIPSNLAIAFHPDFDYAAYDARDTTVIVAEGLAEQVEQRTGVTLGKPIARMKGRALEGLRFQHPLYDRDSVAVLADYVTLDQGTGAVHTAPGHGSDDFATGVRYGLDIYAPVGPGGHFLDEVGLFGGLRVFDANPKIEEALAARRRLWHRETFDHSYPHCWRCHNPVIFLATWQWFIRMDGDGDGPTLREMAVDATEHVAWYPAWGMERMRNMFTGRPDWCISRQRSWGVPIPAVSCTACGEAILTAGLTERAAEVFSRHGADSWYERPIEEFLPDGLACPACGGTAFERERDILDVWFDSGSSHLAVLEQRDGLTWPADIYLEGSDQYRGWFQSSLLVGLGARGRSPYHQVVTHGFVLDDQGRKMSKSLGNVIPPQDTIARSGAEILRLWVAMVDYREDIRLGKEVLARAVEAYRKIRNTFRFLLANLHDFDPATDLGRAGGDAGGGPLRAGALRGRGRAHDRRVRPLRVPDDLLHAERARDRRPERVLPRRVEGRALHLRRRLAGAPLRADRRLPHRGRPGAAHRPDPAGDDRRGVAAPARAPRGLRAPGRVPGGRGRAARPGARRGVGAADRAARDGERRNREGPAAEGDRHLARGPGGDPRFGRHGRSARAPCARPARAVHRVRGDARARGRRRGTTMPSASSSAGRAA